MFDTEEDAPSLKSYRIAFGEEEHMSSLWNVWIVMVCLGSSLVLTGNSAVAQGSGPARVPMSFTGEIVSGISVTREAPAPHHLRVEVCGPDGTRLRHGFPLVVEMRETVRGVVVRNGDAGMAVEATVEGQHATVTLTRDPFRPPEPWRVVILLSIDGGHGEGQLLIGAERYPLPTSLTVGHSTVVLSPGCDERYAGEPAGEEVG